LEFVDIYVEGSYLRRLCGDKSGSEIRGCPTSPWCLYAEYGNYSALRDRTSNGFRIRYEFQEKAQPQLVRGASEGCAAAGSPGSAAPEQSAGVIKSPGYDGSGYLPLTDCTYDIIGSPNERVVLNFIDIHLAESVLCYQDYISLKNIVQGRPTLLMENACGSAKIGTSYRPIRWEEYRGFQLKYHFIRIEDLARARNNEPPLRQDFYSGASGVISSPASRATPSTVADNVRCAWIIQSATKNCKFCLTLNQNSTSAKAASSCSLLNISVFAFSHGVRKRRKTRFCAFDALSRSHRERRPDAFYQ
uniref:CUB domain-containing protein n=1 Tax=Macrostomum lignano TaxID=282301 RepID=A0A1I8F6V3_9PLAT